MRAWLDVELAAGRLDGWRKVKVTDTYFDTADGALAAAGYGARLRRSQGAVSVELKSDLGSMNGLHHRSEVTGPAEDVLDSAAWPPSEARETVASIAGRRRLVERFRLRQRRLERQHALGDGAALLSLDEVEVIVAGAVAGVMRQLEVELLAGDRSALARLDRPLRASGLVRVQPSSKMAQAAALASAAAPVQGSDTWPEAGRKILRAHLLRILEREPRVRTGDKQALKQMRVATRRSRATWRLFADAFRRGARRRNVAALRTLGRALGTARDLDVLLESTRRRRGLRALRETWTARRAQAFADLQHLLDSADQAAFVEEMLELTRRDLETRRKTRGETVAERGRRELLEAYAALVERDAPPAATATDNEWHRLRIASRRLRYAIEALRGAIGEPRAARLIARLVAVQDHLGALNDASVAAREVDDWLAGDGATATAAARRAAEAYRDDRLAESARLGATFAPTWRLVAGRAFRTMLDRAIPPPAPGSG